MDLSFSGAGFMGCYYFGVVNCWNKYIPRERVRRVAGASAGSLIAAYYLMDLPLSGCLKEIIEMTEDIRRRPLGVFDRSNQIVDELPRRLNAMFPDDAHKRCSGRLFVCMTRLRDMKCVIVNEFETKKDLIDALNCSCFIPVWSGNHVATYKGQKYIDGGFTNNLPVFDEHTIRICCFSGASDIAPQDRARNEFMSASVMGMPVQLNWKNVRRAGRALWPPPPSFIMELLERGFHDTKSFILSNDLIQCARCFKATEPEFRPLHAAITPTISPAHSPNLSRASSYMNLADLQRADSFRRLRTVTVTVTATDNDHNKEPSRNRKHPTTVATIKQLEEMLLRNGPGAQCRGEEFSVFGETDRSKSGRQITLKALQRNQEAASERKSFARKLREKLARVASGGSAKRPAASAECREEQKETPIRGSPFAEMPTIVVDQAEECCEQDDEVDDEVEQFELNSEQPAEPKQPATIEEIMRATSAGEPGDKLSRSQSRASSSSNNSAASSAGSTSGRSTADESGDSAVGGLRSSSLVESKAAATRMASQSPAEKFLASRKMSLVASQLELNKQQQDGAGAGATANSLLPDRFSFAPSQLPSCPPSPNLNRHCSECIRMRQQARMDEIDASIKCEAQKYGQLESRDPEKEFTGIRFKLTNFFRQLGAPKYSYEFVDSDEENNNNDNNNNSSEKTSAPQHSPQRRPSEIPTF